MTNKNKKKTYFVNVDVCATPTIQIVATTPQEAVDLARQAEILLQAKANLEINGKAKRLEIVDGWDCWIQNCTTVEEEGQGDELWVDNWNVQEVEASGMVVSDDQGGQDDNN